MSSDFEAYRKANGGTALQVFVYRLHGWKATLTAAAIIAIPLGVAVGLIVGIAVFG